MTPLARSKYSPERAVRSRYTVRICSVRAMTRSRSIEAGMGAVALMTARLLVPAPLTGAVNPPPNLRGLSPYLRALHLAGGGARQGVGELDDARVLVRRGLCLDVVLELAREAV